MRAVPGDPASGRAVARVAFARAHGAAVSAGGAAGPVA